MKTKLDEIRLTNGENMDVYLFEPPEKGFSEKLLSFKNIPNEIIYRNVSSRSAGKYQQGSVDRYFMGIIDGDFAGMVWYSYGRHHFPVANFGEVYTSSEHRGKGISKNLMKYFQSDFENSPAEAAFCTCSNEWIVNIYRQFGFFPALPGTSGGPLMRKGKSCVDSLEAFEKIYFPETDDIEISSADINYRHEADCLLKFILMSKGLVNKRCFAASTVQSYLHALFLVENGRGKLFKALTTTHQRFAGWSFIIEHFSDAPQETCAVFDYEIYPGYAALAEKLVRSSLEQGKQKAVSFCIEDEYEKITILKNAGFKQQAVVPNYYVDKSLFILGYNN